MDLSFLRCESYLMLVAELLSSDKENILITTGGYVTLRNSLTPRREYCITCAKYSTDVSKELRYTLQLI